MLPWEDWKKLSFEERRGFKVGPGPRSTNQVRLLTSFDVDIVVKLRFSQQRNFKAGMARSLD